MDFTPKKNRRQNTSLLDEQAAKATETEIVAIDQISDSIVRSDSGLAHDVLVLLIRIFTQVTT